MLSTIFCHLFSAHAPFRRNSTSGLKYDWVTSIYYKSGEIVSIRHQFGVIFGEFWTAHVGLRYISTSANNSDVRFWLGDPDFIKKVCKFWRYERLKPFLAKFSLCMRFEIRSLIRTRRHRFPIKVLKFGQYGRKFGVIFGDFWTAHARWRYISSSGNKSDVRFALGDPDFL